MKKIEWVFLIFLFIAPAVTVRVFAGNGIISAVDEMGYAVEFDETNSCTNAGSVTFRLDGSRLSPGEGYVYDDGGIISPVENGCYTMSEECAGSDSTGEVNFYIADDTGMTPVTQKPYKIKFCSGVITEPDVEYSGASGRTDATVDIMPQKGVHTFFSLTDIDGHTDTRLVSSAMHMEFQEDGVFCVRAWCMDGKGNRTYSSSLPGKIIKDTSAPEVPELTADRSPVNDSFIYDGTVTFSASSHDAVSGIEDMIFAISGRENVKGGSVQIEPPFKGTLAVSAEDRAGNISDEVSFGQEIIVDADAPDIRIIKAGINGDELELAAEAADMLSGLDHMVLKITAGGDSREIMGQDGQVSFSAPLSSLPYGDIPVSIEASDRAGNVRTGTVMISNTDSEAPIISVSGAEDGGIYGGPLFLTIHAEDASFAGCSFYANIIRTDSEGNMYSDSAAQSSQLVLNDGGRYNISVKATDGAGNTSQYSMAFIIDHEAPVITGMAELDGKKLQEFVLDADHSIYVKDDSLTVYDIYLNGLEYDGRRIRRSGKYVLKFYARDEFGNTAESSAVFAIDAKDRDRSSERSHTAAMKETVSRNSVVTDVSKTKLSSDNIIKGNSQKPEKQRIPALQQEACGKTGKKDFFDWVRCVIINLLD